MITYDIRFEKEEDKIALIRKSEEDFQERLFQMSQDALSDPKIRLLTLSGPSCSGKTTTAKALIHQIHLARKRVKVISLDDFYRNRAVLDAEAKAENRPVDLDSFRSLDSETLKETVEDLFRGGTVRVPLYDFTTGQRDGYDEFSMPDYDLVLFEGIQAVYPEVLALFEEHPYKSMFISVADDIRVNGQFFSFREIRFLRRMVRDYRFRNTTPEETFQNWKGVVENEKKNLDDGAKRADLSISSFMPYEPFLMKVPALELITRIRSDNPFYSDAASLAARFSGIQPITPLYLPTDSVYREFLG